jgi:type IV secretory pathway VirB2 component (pilin)
MRVLYLIVFSLFFTVAFAGTPAPKDASKNKRLKMAESNPVAGIACKAYKVLSSGITKAIIVFLFLITGLGFFIGKISWGIVISLLIGTVLTLSSGVMVRFFVGSAGGGGNGTEDVCKCKHGLDEDCKSGYNS